jgi:hypothetical protein
MDVFRSSTCKFRSCTKIGLFARSDRPRFLTEYRGFASQLRRKNAPNVSKKSELGLEKSDLGPAESNLGAPEQDTNRQAKK